MKQLDEILMRLHVSIWSECAEILEGFNISKNQFKEIIHFLQNQQLVELNNDGIRITSEGIKFLELPN